MAPKSVLPDSFGRVVFALLEDLDTPRSLCVKLLIEHGETEQLLSLECPPARFNDAESYFKDVIATDLLRKCQSLQLGTKSRKRDAAVGTFYQAEKACKASNDRLSPFLLNGPFEGPGDAFIGDVFSEVRGFITNVLGRLPSEVDCRHGPGATYHDRGVRNCIPDKMSTRPTVTSEARVLVDAFWTQTAWFRGLAGDAPNRTDPQTIRGNRFTTVDKDALKDRGICVEPSLNIFFQLGVGKTIRARLLRNGIDLDNGQLTHAQVAREASLSGRFCTIDLSNASDTVCRLLVKLLLPEDWHDVLYALRSPFTSVDGKNVYLEKFSSMGNGFTFELETLIFLGLAVVATRRAGVEPVIGVNVLAYGDDIIVPSEASRGLLALLRFCGFTPNNRKTFTTGWFRESCGGDFYRGESVRAHFVEEFPDEIPAWISLANGLRRLAHQYDGSGVGLWFAQRAWFRVLDNLPSHIRRLRGPVHYGDAVIHDDPHTWKVVTNPGKKLCGQFVRGLVAKPVQLPLERWGGSGLHLACMLYGTGGKVTPRRNGEDLIDSYGFTWLSVS